LNYKNFELCKETLETTYAKRFSNFGAGGLLEFLARLEINQHQPGSLNLIGFLERELTGGSTMNGYLSWALKMLGSIYRIYAVAAIGDAGLRNVPFKSTESDANSSLIP
jgi:hypothetical protein